MSNDLDVIRELEEETGLTFSRNDNVNLYARARASYSQDENGNVCRLVINNWKLRVFPGAVCKLRHLTEFAFYNHNPVVPPDEFRNLSSLRDLHLAGNTLEEFPRVLCELRELRHLSLREAKISSLPPEVGQLRKLELLNLRRNRLTSLPRELAQLESLHNLGLDGNPLESPPPEIVKRGVPAIREYLRQLPEEEEAREVNEAKLILVGEGHVGKTCLVQRLVHDRFIEDPTTEGIDITTWNIPAPSPEELEIRLNVWDFGGQAIYHSTHQFFLTKRSIYLLVWNARRAKDYDHIHRWLHAVQAFGGDSPVVLVLTKLHERDDDLNLKDLRERFPNIVELEKVDSYDGVGAGRLREVIAEQAWTLPHMKTAWVPAWLRVREALEADDRHWIPHKEFKRICRAESLKGDEIDVLDDYLHDLGVILHFRDRLALADMVILDPEWATDAVYKILDTSAVRDQGGVLLHDDLDDLWATYVLDASSLTELGRQKPFAATAKKLEKLAGREIIGRGSFAKKVREVLGAEPDAKLLGALEELARVTDEPLYPTEIHARLLELMERFELAYVLPDKKSHLVAELLPSTELDYSWINEGNLVFTYCYDFLPPGVLPRFIVLAHHHLETTPEGHQLRWREGALLACDGARAQVKVRLVDKYVEIRIDGERKRELLAIIRGHFDQIHSSFANVRIDAQVPCNCAADCPHMFNYESLLLAERKRVPAVQCQRSFEDVPLRALLDGYQTRKSRADETERITDARGDTHLHLQQTFQQIAVQTQTVTQAVDVKVDVRIDLPAIQSDFSELAGELEGVAPAFSKELQRIQDSLDEVAPSDEESKLKKPLNKLQRLLKKAAAENSDLNRALRGTKRGIELAQKVGKTYNKFAQWLGLPTVPDAFL